MRSAKAKAPVKKPFTLPQADPSRLQRVEQPWATLCPVHLSVGDDVWLIFWSPVWDEDTRQWELVEDTRLAVSIVEAPALRARAGNSYRVRMHAIGTIVTQFKQEGEGDPPPVPYKFTETRSEVLAPGWMLDYVQPYEDWGSATCGAQRQLRCRQSWQGRA